MKAPGTAYDDPVIGKDPQPAHMKTICEITRWMMAEAFISTLVSRTMHST